MHTRTPHRDATFSHAFQISRGRDDTWFDPKLHVDTDLFVDPFLLFDVKTAPWNSVHQRLVAFFNEALGQVAESGGKRTSVAWRRASAMFSFPEPPQFCLGYGAKTIFGAGSARGLGESMMARAAQAIQAGVRNIDDFGDSS
ncbi:MAG: hypothetical protein WD156_03840 [Acidimicrobiia bacterium]